MVRRTRALLLVALLVAIPSTAGFGIDSTATADRAADPAADLDRRAASDAPRTALGSFLVTCYALQGRTADGGHVSLDVVAVDPRIVPLGTRMLIEGVGIRVASDTGRKIKGRHLDIWLPTTEACVQFGAQRLGVWLA